MAITKLTSEQLYRKCDAEKFNFTVEYDEDGKDYYNEEYGWIFDEYDLISILNEPIEILETTITLKPDKIEKLDNKYALGSPGKALVDKINEIIDHLQE